MVNACAEFPEQSATGDGEIEEDVGGSKMREPLLHAINICVAHRTLLHARRDGDEAAIAAAEAEVAKLYTGSDFPMLCRYLEWAELHLTDTVEHGHYATEAEHDEEVAIATAILDQVKVCRDDIVFAVIAGGSKAALDAGIKNQPVYVLSTTNNPEKLDPQIRLPDVMEQDCI